MFLFCQSRFCCKIVSFVVLQSFLVLDMAWAADNNGYSKNNPDCLSPEISIASPLFFQQYRKGVNTLESQNVGLPFEISTPKVSFGTSGWRWDEYQDYTDKNGNFKQEEFLNDFYASIIASAEQIKQQEQANPGRTGVIIGGDTRAVGPYSNLDLTNMAAEIFASMGVRVIKADHYLPLPAVSCLIKHLNAAGSVYFTASHNPGKGYSVVREDGSTMQINNDGIKFNPADSGPAGEEITKPLSERANELRAFKQSSAFDAQKHARNIEVLTLQKAAPLYIEALREVIDFDAIKNGFAKGTLDYIVFDTKHGSAVEYYRLIMRMLGLREGIDFEVINSEFDPSFTQMVDPETGEMRPDRPEPDAKYSKHLISRVSRLNAEGKKVIGIACDVDADRNGIVDAGGTFLDPNMTLAIESQYVLQQTFRQWLMEHNPGLAGRLDAFVNTASEMDGLREAVEQFVNDGNVGIAKTIPTSNMLNAIAQLWGCRLEETKVGFKWFRPHLLPGSSKPVLIAGEESQGLNLRSQSQDPAYVVLEKDALTAGLKMLEIVTKTGRSPEQLAGKLQDVIGYFVYQRGGVDLRSKTTPDKIDELKAALKKQLDFLKTLTQSAMITEIGGKKIKAAIFDDGYKFVFSDDSWFCIRFSGTEPVVRLYSEAPAETLEQAEIIRKGNQRIGEQLLDAQGFDDLLAAMPDMARAALTEIDYITRMLGAEGNYATVVEVWKRATDPVALINEYSRVSGKTVEDVLKAFDATDFLKSLSALYRWRTAGALDQAEYAVNSLEISVTNEEYEGTLPQPDVAGQPLSDYLSLMRQIAPNVPNVFRDGMEGFVGTFLGQAQTVKTENPDLKNIVERLKKFLATVDLTRIRYIVTSGIGANEMYSHQLAAAMNAFFSAMGIKVSWIVVNNPEHLAIIPKDADDGNTIVFEMSRSGKTGETRDLFNATKDRFKTRVVAANGEALFNLAKELESAGGKVLVIDDTPGHIGGRQMNRKTLMVYAPLFIALAGGLKDISKAEEYLRAYVLSMLSANYVLDYRHGLDSYGVAAAEFLLRQRESGRNKFAVLYDDTLYPASKELGQLVNEGGNKIIAGGANFNILDSYSLNKDRDLVDMVAAKAAQSQVFVVLLNQNSSAYDDQAAYVEALKRKGIPVLVIGVDLRENDLMYNLQTIARLSSLLQDITVYFTNITQQDANANPAVKLVREITAAMTAMIKEKVAKGETDLTLTADEVFARIKQTQEKGLIDAKGKLDKLGVTRTEFNPVFEQFRSAVTGLAKALGITESKATFIYMKAISDVVKTDMSEPGKLHGSQEVEEAFSRTGLAGMINTLAPAKPPVSLDKEVIVEATDTSRVSVFADKQTLETVTRSQGDTAERIAQYLFEMWKTGRYDMKYMPLAYPEAERNNPQIAELRRFIVEEFGDMDVTSPQCPFPNMAHTGFEAIVSHPLKVFYLAVAYTDTYGNALGQSEVEPGVTVDKAAYVYNLANDYRAPYGGSPSVVFSVKSGKELEYVKNILVAALSSFRKKIDQLPQPAIAGADKAVSSGEPAIDAAIGEVAPGFAGKKLEQAI